MSSEIRGSRALRVTGPRRDDATGRTRHSFHGVRPETDIGTDRCARPRVASARRDLRRRASGNICCRQLNLRSGDTRRDRSAIPTGTLGAAVLGLVSGASAERLAVLFEPTPARDAHPIVSAFSRSGVVDPGSRNKRTSRSTFAEIPASVGCRDGLGPRSDHRENELMPRRSDPPVRPVFAESYAAKSSADEHDSIGSQQHAIRERARSEPDRELFAEFAESNRSGWRGSRGPELETASRSLSSKAFWRHASRLATVTSQPFHWRSRSGW